MCCPADPGMGSKHEWINIRRTTQVQREENIEATSAESRRQGAHTGVSEATRAGRAGAAPFQVVLLGCSVVQGSRDDVDDAIGDVKCAIEILR